MNIAMNNGRHQAEKDGWWQRRSKWGKVGILTTALLSIAGVAWAIIVAIGAVTGSVTPANYDVTLDAVAALPAGETQDPACTVTADTTNNELVVSWDGALADSTCFLSSTWSAPSTNTSDMALQELAASPASLLGQLYNSNQCGLLLPPGTSKTVHGTITFDGSETATFSLQAGDGYQWARASDFDSAQCGTFYNGS